jgi:NAD+ kinase
MKIAIYGHYFSQDAEKYIQDLLDALKSKNAKIYIEERFSKLIQSSFDISVDYKTYNSYTDLDSSFDYMFTLGGDGTVLRSIMYLRDSNIPVIGVNIGRLGFLATVNKEEIPEAIESLHNKKYTIKERSLLTVKTEPKIDEVDEFNFALNEITISRKNTTSMITIETYVDDEYLTSYWADGLITSTPTGSTGYSLSCGGPVISSQAKNFVLTPIAPHNLNARPLVIPDDTKLKMKVHGRENTFFISLDSRIATIDSKTEIFIEKAPFTIKMIELNNQTFIQTLRKKLLWGEDTRNK